MFSKKEQWIIFCTVNVLAVLIALLFLFYKSLVALLPEMPCGMVKYLHLYCPACGGTRALDALLSFDLLMSLRYNPIVPMGAAAFVLYEIGMIRHLVRGDPRPTLIGIKPVCIALGAWFVFFVVRNVLLLCGIDFLGDILV
ncbi:MAG: DUF2752 domain-containing protein [Clostridia bacterium]|nr:DUF2752 domain-containing protein [Clostridia bacterium]